MSTFSKIRVLKISSQYKKIIFKNPILKPKLTLSGDWMKKAGFEIGQNVEVQIKNNQLIITKI